MEPIRERRHRLPADSYVGARTVAFTACVQGRVHLFANADAVGALERLLHEATELYHCEIEIYLFMPDHLHVVLLSFVEDGDPLSTMKRFKQRSSFQLMHRASGIRWQKDFYDRIVRSPRELGNHIRYILLNPVRAGLVDTWKAYPYKGSTLHDLDNWEM